METSSLSERRRAVLSAREDRLQQNSHVKAYYGRILAKLSRLVGLHLLIYGDCKVIVPCSEYGAKESGDGEA
jgi:hypothetical protein